MKIRGVGIGREVPEMLLCLRVDLLSGALKYRLLKTAIPHFASQVADCRKQAPGCVDQPAEELAKSLIAAGR